MTKTASPLHARPVPTRVSKPTAPAEAAAIVAETAAAPAKRAAKKKAKVAAPAAMPTGSTKPLKPAAPAKVHKAKLVRDSFTMPKDEYQAIDALKARALGLERQVRKSELLRAGIQALSAMNDRTFLKAIAAVPTLKTGRPKAD